MQVANKLVEENSCNQYAAPKLTVFGAMAELTAGGSGAVTENMCGGMASDKTPIALC